MFDASSRRPVSPCRRQGLSRPSDQALLSPYPSKMKKSACRPACAPLRSSATARGSRFRQRWSALSYSPTIAPIRARASLESLGGACRSTVRVVEARLPPAAAHAGAARRAAMDLAEAWLVEGGERDGVILTTDADSQVGAELDRGRTSPPSRLALRRFSDASISMRKASSCPTRFIGAASSRTRMRDCSPNCLGCSTPLSTIRGPITPRSRARALA